jgi:hypothetical protein
MDAMERTCSLASTIEIVLASAADNPVPREYLPRKK